MERDGQITRRVSMPKIGDVPDGFVYIDGGPTWIGGASANALPREVKQIAPFVIYHDEISMGDYAQFLKAIGSEAKARLPRDSGKPLATLGPNGLVPADGTDPQKFAQSAARGVSYSDAQAYADWRSRHDGIVYRLPSEFEWEAACRGVDGRHFSWGNVAGRGEAIALQSSTDSGNNMSWNWQDYKDESPWGVHDLAGGVAEWTSSTYKETAQAGDPLYGQRTIKGDAWSLPPEGLECAFRTSGQPDYTHPTVGFRIAADWPVKHIAQPQQPDTSTANPPVQTSTIPKPKPEKKMTHAEEVIHKLGLDK
jgi:formylglycine-generating enzyme required for sulfatase activity